VIVVVDYGVNNLKSVVRALAAGGHAATLTTDPDEVRRADHVVVPGVGHFGRRRARSRPRDSARRCVMPPPRGRR